MMSQYAEEDGGLCDVSMTLALYVCRIMMLFC